MQEQIVKHLRVVSKNKEINFLTVFFEMSKVNIICKAYHISVQCARLKEPNSKTNHQNQLGQDNDFINYLIP